MSFYGLSLYLKARPALVQRDQQLPQDLAGCGRGNAGGVQRGGQFVEVRTHDVGLGHGADGLQQLQKAHAAGLRGAGAGEAGGVQAVEVNGQVNGYLAGTELLGELGKAREIELVHLSVGSRKLKLGAVTAADAELVDASVADEVMAAAQDTGVAELCAQIVVPQVGMGIKVDDVEVGVFFHHGPHGTQRDQMLAAQQERELAVTKRAFDGLKELPHVHVLGSDRAEEHTGILTFTIDDVHPHDVSEILIADGICVRAGHHCAQPLLNYLGISSATRASFMFYNTEEEADKFVAGIASIRERMGYGK